MKRFLQIFCIVGGVLFFAHSAFAIVLPFHDFFHIPTGDVSFKLLGRIFGLVGTPETRVIGTQEGILGAMFRVFNEAMLALATIIIMYTLIISIVRTAHEGEFLGKKFDSLWVPLRSVAGFALIIPTPSGYSIIQIVFMWIIIQGIGAADTLWHTAVSRLVLMSQQGSGPVIAPVTTYNGPPEKIASAMLSDSICMHNSCKNNASCSTSFSGDTLQPQIVESSDTTHGVPTLIGYAYGEVQPDGSISEGGCGKVLWPNPQRYSSTDINYKKYNAITNAMPMISSLIESTSKNHVWYKGTSSEIVYSATTNPILQAVAYINGPLQKIADDYIDQMKDNLPEKWKGAVNAGWIYAGAFYHEIATMGNQAQSLVDVNDLQFLNQPTLSGVDKSFVSTLFAFAYQPDMLPTLGPAGNPPLQMDGSGNISTTSNAWLKFIYYPFNTVVRLFALMVTFNPDMTNPQTGYFSDIHVDPLVKIQALGNRIVKETEIVYAIGFGLMLTASIGLGLCSMFTPGFAILDLLYKMVVTPLMWVLGMLLVSGFTFSVYVPLTPFIIFTFAAVGWFIATIETMIAAPMVALGICYPEGSHDLLGRADPAIMLITNVFLRPTLMVFGMIAGMVLTYVAVSLFNSIYGLVVGSITVGGGTDVWSTVGPIQFVMFLIIYVVSIVAIVNRSFALIHMIPDRVLQWIGGTAQFGQYAQGMEDTVSGAAKGVAGEGKGFVSGTSQKFGEKVSSAKAKSKDKADAATGKKAAAQITGGSTDDLPGGDIPGT